MVTADRHAAMSKYEKLPQSASFYTLYAASADRRAATREYGRFPRSASRQRFERATCRARRF